MGCRLGVEGLQPLVERHGSLLLRLLFQPDPDRGIGAGELQRIDDRTEVEAGPAHEQGQAAPRQDVGHGSPRHRLELGDRQRVGRLEHVDEVVADPPQVRR